jgi:hypothetical protein
MAVVALTLAQPAFSMEFSVVNPGQIPVVYGAGKIVAGDAERLRAALPLVPRDNSFMKTLALDSPGGSVQAALDMAAVMDEFGVSTVVPPGATCASACASVLFVAGKYHIVAVGGRLGIHTCYDGTTKIRDELCNERIAQFAVEHGTAYGAVYAFEEYTNPDGMVWFSGQDADCQGLSKYPAGEEPAGYMQCVFEAIRKATCQHSGTCGQ